MDKIVLILEDDPQTGSSLSRLLKSWGATVTWVKTIVEAREYINNHLSEIVLMYFDAMVPYDDTVPAHAGINASLPLVQEFRPKFKGIMFACSAFRKFNDELKSAGCQYANEKPIRIYLLQKAYDEAVEIAA